MDRKHSKGGKEFNPETLALGYGYDPFLSEGSVKPPVFLTSTFQFRSAAEGERFFQLAYGLRQPDQAEIPGLIYSRLNNPNIEIVEDRLAAWDGTEKGGVFASGMAAITTTALSLLTPGDCVVSTRPIYGGTHYLFDTILPHFGIEVRWVPAGNDAPRAVRSVAEEVGVDRVRMLFVETPANPSNVLTDVRAVSDVARELSAESGRSVTTVVDNTFLGPVFQRPAAQGADLVVYSATKFIGGHSDLIAGVVTGPESLMSKIKIFRTILGTVANPFTGWLLLRSLETVSVRMRRQAKSAARLARTLAEHPCVRRVCYPGLLEPGDPQYEIYTKQCTGPGSLIAFEVVGGKEEAHRVLDAFEVARLAVSLGGTESLVEHPMSMTHSDVPPEQLRAIGVTPGLIRMSVGLEHLSDLRRDLRYALATLDPSLTPEPNSSD